MLYYIVPPIIIVLSLVFLISFLFRKFSMESNVNPDILDGLNGRKEVVEEGGKMGSFFAGFWLGLLEKITQRLKLFSLKMHNASNSWFHLVRNKRSRISSTEKIREVEKELMSNEEKPEVSHLDEGQVASQTESEKIIESKPKRIENFSIRQRIVRKRMTSVAKEDSKPKIEPMEKNRLEEALIKRIAVNPKDIEAYERLGDYYSDIKNFKDALECYKQVAKLSPRNFKAKAKMRSLERILKG